MERFLELSINLGWRCELMPHDGSESKWRRVFQFLDRSKIP